MFKDYLIKADKNKVLNTPNYDGTATNEDFPFEAGDWIIDRKNIRAQATKFSGFIKPHKIVILNLGKIEEVEGVHQPDYRYATQEEIRNSNEKI